jgi:effector-binding domain-containing protein
MEITENCTLKMENVLSFRRKMTQTQIAEQMKKIGEILSNTGAKKNGAVTTATFAIESNNPSPILDIEILVPLDREITVPDGYSLKHQFCLTNAIKLRHMGNPATLQTSVNELSAYMEKKRQTPITVGYNVTIKDAASQQELDSMIVDIYVGVSPNQL